MSLKSFHFNFGGGGIEQTGKRTQEHGQQCGDCRGHGDIRGLNGKISQLYEIWRP